MDAPLRAQLAGKAVIEFPSLIVALPGQAGTKYVLVEEQPPPPPPRQRPAETQPPQQQQGEQALPLPPPPPEPQQQEQQQQEPQQAPLAESTATGAVEQPEQPQG